LSCVFLFGIATRDSFSSITGLQASEKKKTDSITISQTEGLY